MVRILQASNDVLSYLQKFDTHNSLTVGLILGQSCEGRFYVVHLAKTILPNLQLKKISELNDLWLVDHAKQATRMLPGGLHVIGMFLVSDTDLVSSVFPNKLKSILHHLNKSLSVEYLYGNTENNEMIVLNYFQKGKNVNCKSFNTVTSSSKSVEVKFTDDIGSWIKLECRYELDEIYYLEEDTHEVDLKKHMNIILKDVSNNLKSSIVLYDGELKTEDDTLDSVGKKKILRGGKINYTDSEHEDKRITVSILQNCSEIFPDVSIRHTNNQIKIVGQIVSMVWLNPIVSFKVVTSAIIQDIMRSLSTRLEMHWDSLIEEEHKEGSNSIHELPRRVTIALPQAHITVSDYLFPGEGAEEAKNSVEEILDIQLQGYPNEIQDVEGSIDIATYGKNINHMVDGKITTEEQEHSRMLFCIGSLFALVVLIISVLVHLVFKNI